MIVIADPEAYKVKEDAYIKAREAESRIIPDELLLQLPSVSDDHPYFAEWQQRKASLSRLLKYLSAKRRALHILDVGCGNGWMTHALYEAGHSVTGVDLNMFELKQAERVFGTNEKLQWAFADVVADDLPFAPFDIILFAASCQYFPDIAALTRKIACALSPEGEIHLMDSMFYKKRSANEARTRSITYYGKLGTPEMISYYFHHARVDISQIGYKRIYPVLAFRKTLEWWRYTRATD